MSLLDSNFLFGLIGALAALAPAIIAIWRWCRHMSKQWGTFMEDWVGQAARPGVPTRYGVMERLASLEADTMQLRRNGGAHLADKIEAIVEGQTERAARMARIEESLADMGATLRVGEHRFERIDRALSRLEEGHE